MAFSPAVAMAIHRRFVQLKVTISVQQYAFNKAPLSKTSLGSFFTYVIPYYNRAFINSFQETQTKVT